MSNLRCQNLCKSFYIDKEEIEVLKNISLNINLVYIIQCFQINRQFVPLTC